MKGRYGERKMEEHSRGRKLRGADSTKREGKQLIGYEKEV